MKQRIDIRCRHFAGYDITPEALGLPDTPEGWRTVEEYAEICWQDATDEFWTEIALLKEELGFLDAEQAGRSGGWLIVTWPDYQAPEELPQFRAVANSARELAQRVDAIVEYFQSADYKRRLIEAWQELYAQTS